MLRRRSAGGRRSVEPSAHPEHVSRSSCCYRSSGLIHGTRTCLYMPVNACNYIMYYFFNFWAACSPFPDIWTQNPAKVSRIRRPIGAKAPGARDAQTSRSGVLCRHGGMGRCGRIGGKVMRLVLPSCESKTSFRSVEKMRLLCGQYNLSRLYDTAAQASSLMMSRRAPAV